MKKIFLLACIVVLSLALPDVTIAKPDIINPKLMLKYCNFFIVSNPHVTGSGEQQASSIMGFPDKISLLAPKTMNPSLLDEGMDNNVGTIEYEGTDCRCKVKLWPRSNYKGRPKTIPINDNKGVLKLDTYWSKAVSSYQIYY